MSKARSRLRLKQKKRTTTRAGSRLKKINKKRISIDASIFKRYIQHLPTLFVSLPFFYASGYILTKIYPSEIKNLLLSNAYLPLQITVFLANFFFFSFLTLKTRRGLLVSLCISTFLFLKLEKVIIDYILVSSILLFFVIIELILTYLEKNNANFK
ncbi:MAG: hypothetical protein PVJ09_03665 [Candidatus Woesebacteria bacterium]|jgi:hypothetical protein